jgi:hypothetical protein
MKLVQILLPLRDNQGRKFDQPLYAEVHDELISRFGGVTAYTRSPARGLWQSAGSTKRDDVIIVEVMATTNGAVLGKPLGTGTSMRRLPGFAPNDLASCSRVCG